MPDLCPESRARMETRMYEIYPRPRGGTPDVVDVARWDAFKDGFGAAHVEAEERQRGLEDRLAAVEKAWEMDRALHWTTDGADELVERVRVLSEALTEAEGELRRIATITADEDAALLLASADRAAAVLAVSSTENEEEQK